MKELDDDIKSGKYKRVYLLFGEEVYLKKTYEQKMTSSVVSEDFNLMNCTVFEDKTTEVKKIIDAVDTLPFMSEYRLVVVRESELFYQGRKDDSERMTAYIENIPESSVLIFVESKVDKRGALYKKVAKLGQSVEFKPLKEGELAKWLVDSSGKRMGMSTAMYLVNNVDSSMQNLKGELEKLLDYVPKAKEITKADIDLVCTKSLETRVFDLVDALANKKLVGALEIYNNMIMLKESPLLVLNMLARQFRLILQCKYLTARGQGSRDIAVEIGANEFVVKKCMAQSRNFKNKDLIEAINDCLKCDLDIKNGRIGDKLGVEMLLVKYGGGV